MAGDRVFGVIDFLCTTKRSIAAECGALAGVGASEAVTPMCATSLASPVAGSGLVEHPAGLKGGLRWQCLGVALCPPLVAG